MKVNGQKASTTEKESTKQPQVQNTTESGKMANSMVWELLAGQTVLPIQVNGVTVEKTEKESLQELTVLFTKANGLKVNITEEARL